MKKNIWEFLGIQPAKNPDIPITFGDMNRLGARTSQDAGQPPPVTIYEKMMDLCGIYGWLRDENLARIQDAIESHDIYDSEMWGSLIEKRSHDDYDPSMLEAGLGTLLVDVSASYLFDRGLDFECTNEKVTDEIDTERQRALYDLYEENNMDVVLQESAVTSGIEGDVFFELWKPDGENQLVIIPHAGVEVFPIYYFRGGANSRRMPMCHICYEIEYSGAEAAVWKQTYWLDGGECYVSTQIWDLGGKPNEMRFIEEVRAPEKNGLPFIPIYHIRNKGKLNKYFGFSDYHAAKEILVELDKAMSDLADARAFNAFPTKVLKGPGLQDAQNSFKLGPNRVWYLGADTQADAKMLSVTSDFYAAMQKNIDILRDILLEVMETPPVALGHTENLRDTSGVALEVLFSRIASKTTRKRKYWEVLRHMNSDALRMMEIYNLGNFDGVYQNKLIWGDILPRSMERDVNTMVQAVAGKLMAPSSAMDYIGIEDPVEEQRKIKKERMNESPYGSETARPLDEDTEED